MRNVIVFAALALVIAGLAPNYLRHVETEAAARPAPAEPAADALDAHNMTIAPSENGHFRVDAEIEGRHMDLVVDTGASTIALRERDASRLGIHPAEREYTVRVSTANGMVLAAPIELERVEVGSLTVRNVAALVLPDEALSENLLGMSFLSHVRWEHRDDGRFVLEQ